MAKKFLEPSLLSIDKQNGHTQLLKIQQLGIPFVHYDVMDGEFTTGKFAFDTEFLSDLQKLGLKANVHLMVENPQDYFEKYFAFEINSLAFHVETQNVKKAKELLAQIRAHGIKAGIAVNMETDLNQYIDLANDCDLITVMSVVPGRGGQAYDDACMHNLEVCKQFKKINPKIIVQLDGGVNNTIIDKNWNYVDSFVSGSWFFKNIDNFNQFLSKFN